MTTNAEKPKRYTKKDLRLDWREEHGEQVADLPGAGMRISVRRPLLRSERWCWRLNHAQETNTWMIDSGDLPGATTDLQAQGMAEACVLSFAQSIVRAFTKGESQR